MSSNREDRADVELVFAKYLRSLEAADVALASQVWLQSPDVLVVTPIGRFQGWEGVTEIWEKTQKEFSERKVQASNISIVVAVCCNPWELRITHDGDERYVDVSRADGSE